MAKIKHNVLPELSAADIIRFWKLVDKGEPDQCWPWKGYLTQSYGKFYVKQFAFKAHRVSYFIAHTIDPGEQKCLHSCDNPPCCNPGHIFLGTQLENIQDMFNKGRGNRSSGTKHWTHLYPDKVVRGENHPMAKDPTLAIRGDSHWMRQRPENIVRGEAHHRTKVSDADIQKIITLYRPNSRSGEHSPTSIAKQFGISRTHVHRLIRNGR